MTDIDYIKSNLGARAKLGQIIEECGELVAALAKYERAIAGENPTNVHPIAALDRVQKEIADVLNAIDVYTDSMDKEEIDLIRAEKLERWRGRLEARDAEE